MSKVAIVAWGLWFAVNFCCLAIGLWFQGRKHDLSGIPNHHYAVNENGRLFYVHRGGPPLDQGRQYPLTPEQYRLWEENERAGGAWLMVTALCTFGAVGVGIVWGSNLRSRGGPAPS